MHKNDADDVMQQFRSGELNILVSTSILAEGVDVAECNGVIRYMCIGDAIGEVQVVGKFLLKTFSYYCIKVVKKLPLGIVIISIIFLVGSKERVSYCYADC